jgi:xanthine/CO dehydrogenase XdhC/CoxF family maturation factor
MWVRLLPIWPTGWATAWLSMMIALSWVTPEVIPNADFYLPGPLPEALTQFQVTAQTYVAAVTRNIQVDREILPQLLATPAPYIGVIGSRRRWVETSRLLLADGLTEEQLARFHSPVGLEIHAETPAEIAVSIMAEIILRHRAGELWSRRVDGGLLPGVNSFYNEHCIPPFTL